jgi:hypothetical protein
LLVIQQLISPNLKFLQGASSRTNLTLNESFVGMAGGKPMQFTGKVTSVCVKLGNAWGVVRGHEPMNQRGQ